MEYGEWMIELYNMNDESVCFFTGTKAECEKWRDGVEAAMQAMNTYEYRTELKQLKKV